MLAAERREQIALLIRESGWVQVSELCARFGSSTSTIRRDLQALEEQGILRREHGGASAAEGDIRSPHRLSAENRLAARADRCLADGETVFMSAGAYALPLARHLATREGISVITNALDAASHLAELGTGTVVLTGGQVERPGSALVGHIAESALHDLRADTALISVSGLHVSGGATGDSLPQAGLLRQVVDTVSRVIVIAEAARWGQVGPVHLIPLQEIDVIVTSRDAPSAMVWDVIELGIEVIQV